MSWNKSLLIVSLLIIFTLIGVGIGYGLTPEYQKMVYNKNEMGLGEADYWLDLRYINEMIAHHKGAILLAEKTLNHAQKPEIKALVQDIIKNEPIAIDELYKWKKDWYGETKKVKDPTVANLGVADETFDLRFLNALIFHHQSGILMTKEVRLKSSRSEVLNNADAVENFLNGSLKTLTDWRLEWYKI